MLRFPALGLSSGLVPVLLFLIRSSHPLQILFREGNLLPDLLVQVNPSLIAHSDYLAAPTDVQILTVILGEFQHHETHDTNVLDFGIWFEERMFGEGGVSGEDHEAEHCSDVLHAVAVFVVCHHIS